MAAQMVVPTAEPALAGAAPRVRRTAARAALRVSRTAAPTAEPTVMEIAEPMVARTMAPTASVEAS
jgi:hypothetical protein